MTNVADDNNLRHVHQYYDATESRVGYRLFLSGTKHFGWYDDGDAAWRFAPALRRMEDKLGEKLALPTGSLVLDAGCGNGDVAMALAARFGFRIIGIDILGWNLAEGITSAEATGLTERVRFEWGDYHSLEFADAMFDGCYTMETLVHASDPDKVMAEFYRVLKPGGRITLFEYSHVPRTHVSQRAWSALERVCELGVMPSWLIFEDGVLDQKLRKAGFVDVSTIDITSHILPMLKIFAKIGAFPYWLARRLDKVDKAVNAMSGVEMYRHRDVWKYNITVAAKPD